MTKSKNELIRLSILFDSPSPPTNLGDYIQLQLNAHLAHSSRLVDVGFTQNG